MYHSSTKVEERFRDQLGVDGCFEKYMLVSTLDHQAEPSILCELVMDES
jgi:hypothetical protein